MSQKSSTRLPYSKTELDVPEFDILRALFYL